VGVERTLFGLATEATLLKSQKWHIQTLFAEADIENGPMQAQYANAVAGQGCCMVKKSHGHSE
jgi:hypothetical protein